MTHALHTQAAALLTKRCAVCGSGEIPVGQDDHPRIHNFAVMAPKLFACADTPARWYGNVIAVFHSPACGARWRETARLAA